MTKDWKWWAGRNEEHFTVGPCATREEAVEIGRGDFDCDGFFVIEAVQRNVESLIPSAQSIIEGALESAADDGEFGEDGDFGLSGKATEHAVAFHELDQALEAWTEKWKHLLPVPWLFQSQRNMEWIEPEPAEAAA